MFALLENRIFRVVLLIITLIVFYVWISGFSGDGETASEVREDAETSEIATTETVTAAPVPSRVVIDAGPTTDSAEDAENKILDYVIQSGDTINSIAVKFNTTDEAIRLANPGIEPGNLFAGETIRILGASTDANAVDNPSAEREEGVEVVYFVDAGDTMGAIAFEYTVDLDVLIAANPQVDANNLQVGDQLTIPEFGAGIPPEQLTPEPTPEVITRPQGQASVHVVSEGDSVVFLSVLYDVAVDTILAANPDLDADNLAIGQEINIPPSQPTG